MEKPATFAPMHAGRSYSLAGVLMWTRREIAAFAVIASLPYVMDLLGWGPAKVPWTPLAALGTAVAFVTGFKGNAASRSTATPR